jgi:glycosyltransferase involved in cell wall biosynthesis
VVLRVGVDATCWQNNRGYGRHARALLKALVYLDRKNQYTFFMDSSHGLKDVPAEAEVRVTNTSSPTAIAASADGHRRLTDLWRIGRAMASPDIDVLFFPTIYSYVPVMSRSKKVVMIHDVIAESFPQLTLPRRQARLFWRTKVALGRWQASALVTVSEHSRRGLANHFNITADRIFVVGEASDPVFRVIETAAPTRRMCELGFNATRRNVIYVGGFGPHKNLEMLVEVFGRIAARSDMSDVRLVLVGQTDNEVFHSYIQTVNRRVVELGLADRVVFTGYLPDEELSVLLNLSTTLVLPSLLEGFGLPAVEAAACGLPVIATTASPLPEILDGALFVNPHDRSGWEQALIEVLSSAGKRWAMREAGLAATRLLTWDAAARQLMDVFGNVTTMSNSFSPRF